MLVVPLVEAGRIDLVGGKASALGELIRLGERVPDGFVVTTEAYATGVVPEAEIAAAWTALGGGPVAVRSSATAEDGPDASFAGQYDTVLGVTTRDGLVAAVATCWRSLHGDRAVAYRTAHAIDGGDVRMAVIIQRMVDATTAGVLFTADPVSGSRSTMVVDATPGPGSAVVDGTTDADHHVLSEGSDGWDDLRAAGRRLRDHFGAPQDVEWAVDAGGALWILQSRPITTLFPLPPATGGDPRIYLEFGNVQGMLQPVTPMGMSTLKKVVAAMTASLGLRVEIVDIGGRLYGDLTALARHPAARKRLVRLMAVDFGPRAQRVMEHILDDPRFAPRKQARQGLPKGALGTAFRAARGITAALARPEKARLRLLGAVEDLRLASAAPPEPLTTADRLRFVQDDGHSPGADNDNEAGAGADAIAWPIVAGLLASAAPPRLLRGLATEDEVRTVLGGMPHNVTIEMDLALWQIAVDAAGHRTLLLDTPPATLADRFRRGELPELGLTGFLATYGHRAAAEADLGVPRWSEDPAPVFAALANYLRVTDPEQAPDRRFARATATAGQTMTQISVRTKRFSVRARLALFLLGRARSLAGLRELGKFAGLYRLNAVREQLLLIGAALTGNGQLTAADDIMLLTLDEVADAVHHGADHRPTAAGRAVVRRRELRRRTVPVALLSDGTDVETLLAAGDGAPGVHKGVGASAGCATGPARVITDPAAAHIEPGEILVAATTDPGWTPLFLTAAALVTETGAVMAHGPTVAREYGMPAVISVRGATTAIRTGDLITVDGAAGTVTPVPLTESGAPAAAVSASGSGAPVSLTGSGAPGAVEAGR